MNARVKTESVCPTIAGIPTVELSALFDHCNKLYFNNELQLSPGFQLTFSRSVRLSGCFTYCLETHQDWGIEISQRLQAHPRALLSTLVHEMVHMLAHQRFRKTGNTALLDEAPRPGEPFVNPGHGAFFLRQLERLNREFPALGLTVKSTFGDHLYDHSKIAPVRLLLVFISRSEGKGMVYRLHPQAPLDWGRLETTAAEIHGVSDIKLVEVPGHLAEGFPALRRDNAPRKNMRRLSLRHFDAKVEKLLGATGAREYSPVARLVTPDLLKSGLLKHSPGESHTPSSANTPWYLPRSRPAAHESGSCADQM